jgi:hypothetical protein
MQWGGEDLAVNPAKINHKALARWAERKNTDYRIALLIWALAISRADADEIWQNGHRIVAMAAQAIADKKNMTLRWGATTIVPLRDRAKAQKNIQKAGRR